MGGGHQCLFQARISGGQQLTTVQQRQQHALGPLIRQMGHQVCRRITQRLEQAVGTLGRRWCAYVVQPTERFLAGCAQVSEQDSLRRLRVEIQRQGLDTKFTHMVGVPPEGEIVEVLPVQPPERLGQPLPARLRLPAPVGD